jgi:hypothetical protein
MSPEIQRLINLIEKHEKTANWWKYQANHRRKRLVTKHKNKVAKLRNCLTNKNFVVK